MNKYQMFAIRCSILFAVAVCLTNVRVSAQPSVVPFLTVKAPGLAVAVTNAPASSAFQLAPDGKSWELKPNGQYHIPGAPFVDVLELRFDPDPQIFNNYLVQNPTAIVQTYTIGLSLATVLAAPNQIRGSISTSIIGTDGQISTFGATPIYTALIDSVAVQTLQNSPFSLTTSQDAVSSLAQFGFNPNNTPVNSSIGIQLVFQLSPGDTAAIISDFEVIPVPEPGTVALVLLGSGLLAYRRQRR